MSTRTSPKTPESTEAALEPEQNATRKARVNEIQGGSASLLDSSARIPKSGLLPPGDVRLTANIRAELHLKLKIKAAQERTTIGELIENWIQTW